MQYIGRIITKSKLTPKYELVLVTDKYEESESLPTIIVGKELAKSILGENFSLLDRRITPTLSWTFSEMEHRLFFEKDLDVFYTNLFGNLLETTKYRFINIYRTPLKTIKCIIAYLLNHKLPIYVYISNNNVYFTVKNEVRAFSLVDCEFLGINREKILKKLYSNRNVKIIDERKSTILHTINAVKRENCQLIPYLCSLID